MKQELPRILRKIRFTKNCVCVCVLFFVVLVGSKIMSKVYIFIFVYSPKTGKACLFSAPLQALGFDTTIYVYLICVCLYMYIHICMVSYV